MNDGDRSLIDALNVKYGHEEEPELGVEIFVPKSAPGKKDSGEIIIPKEICLSNYDIVKAGEERELRVLCKNATYLDISNNLISDWNEVFKILNQIPECEFLNIIANPMPKEKEKFTVDVELQKTYPMMKHLLLNSLFLQWEVIYKLLQLFPNLEQLYLSSNKYTTVDLPSDLIYSSLRFLHFNDNRISDFKVLNKLGKVFPNLENFIFIRNPLENLPVEESDHDFKQLKYFNLTDTKIPCWQELEKLNHFKQLVEIRIQGIEFLEVYEKNLRRQLTIVHLPNIASLNGTKVTDSERIKAERQFLRHYMDASVKPKRYEEVEEIHGKPEALAQVNLNLKPAIEVQVKYINKVVNTTILNKWTVRELKKHLQSLVELPASRMRIWHQESDGYISDLVELLSENLTVSRYDIHENDELLIDEKAVNSTHGVECLKKLN